MSNHLMILKQVGFALLAATVSGSVAVAQTSGTLDSQNGDSWSSAPWVITAGAGTYPDGGGTATFLEELNTVVGITPVRTNVFLDVPVTLSGIDLRGTFGWQIQGNALNPLTLSATGATISAEFPNSELQRYVISAPLVGGGSSGLTKTGVGDLTLTGTKSYNGGTHLNGGTIEITSGDATLGASGAGNGLSMNGGTLRVTSGSFTTSRAITIGSGGGRVELPVNGTFNGAVDGSGEFIITGTDLATFAADNSLTGVLTLATRNMSLIISGPNGAFRSAASYNFFGGGITLDNSSANNNDRLNNTAPIAAGANTRISLLGNAAATTTEMAGVLNVAGTTRVISIAGAGQQAIFNFAGINRQNRATLFLAGTNFGTAPGADVAQITSATSPGTLIGGGGAGGSTNISILPWATGKNSTGGGFNSSTHLTYESSTGRLRPLGTNEYSPAFGVGPTTNVRLTADTVAPTGTTANALLFAPSSPAVLSGGPINITSGSFVHSPSSFFFPAASTVSAGLNFGAAEGIIRTTQNLNISGPITGSGGLTISPAGFTVTLSGTNTYSGPTHIFEGVVQIASGMNPSFGNSNEINLHPGAIIMGNVPTLSPRNSPASGAELPSTSGILDIFINIFFPRNAVDQPSVLERLADIEQEFRIEQGADLRLTGGATPANVMRVNGDLTKVPGQPGTTDPTTVSITANSYVALNGNNEQDATELQGHVIAGNDRAFGNGLLIFSLFGASLEGSGGIVRTFDNHVELRAAASLPGGPELRFTGEVNLDREQNVNVGNLVTITGPVTGGALQKSGAGTLGLGNPAGNTFRGGLEVLAGTLEANNSTGFASGPGTTYVASAARLRGAFRMASALVEGALGPGNGAGTATFQGDLQLTDTAQTEMELASSSSADHLNIANLLTLDGTVKILTIGGYVAQPGTVFNLFDWGTLDASNFDPATDLDFTGAAVAPGFAWDTSQFLVNGTIAVTPEPSTGLVVVLGTALVTAQQLRRRRHWATDAGDALHLSGLTRAGAARESVPH